MTRITYLIRLWNIYTNKIKAVLCFAVPSQLVEKVSSLKNTERSENKKFSVNPFIKGLSGVRGGSPKACECFAHNKSRVYGQSETVL